MSDTTTPTALDERIGEALQTIGSIVEHDEGVPYEAVAGALQTLAQITRSRGEARTQRLAGNIARALEHERYVEHCYSHLPAGAQW